jgi:hypothetical protein
MLTGDLESFEPTKNLQIEPQTIAKWEDQDEKDDMVVKEKDSQSYPPDQDKMELEGSKITTSEEKESWVTIVKKKKYPTVMQRMVKPSQNRNLV